MSPSPSLRGSPSNTSASGNFRASAAKIRFFPIDNAFVEIADWPRAQELAESFQVARWERKFHEMAARFCPVVEKFTHGYHWSVMQVEYALDVVFTKREQLADDTAQRYDLDRISRTVRDQQHRTWRGFNLFLKEDLQVLLAVVRSEFLIHGLSNRRLRAVLPGKTAGQVARILRRLRQHGLLKKVGGTYRYYLSEMGRRLLVAARRVSEHVILPALQPQPA